MKLQVKQADTDDAEIAWEAENDAELYDLKLATLEGFRGGPRYDAELTEKMLGWFDSHGYAMASYSESNGTINATLSRQEALEAL